MTTEIVVFLFWRPRIVNIRTDITLHYAEIQDNLDMLEEFLNNLKHSTELFTCEKSL